uniref:Uncharacterized protein n=1 Tax=Kalanchoe fedtschenkoi TaxID=63787 RepID=A0A7N0VM46_KALFE
MQVEGLIHVLNHMRPFHLHQQHPMALNPEVERVPEADIAEPVLICLTRFHGEQRLLSGVPDFARLAVDQHPNRSPEGSATVKLLLELSMALCIPVPCKDRVVVLRVSVWHRNEQTAVDTQATIPASRLLESNAGIVEIAPDLILHLKMVREVLARRNRAHGPRGSILPRVLPLLDSIPTSGKCNHSQHPDNRKESSTVT